MKVVTTGLLLMLGIMLSLVCYHSITIGEGWIGNIVIFLMFSIPALLVVTIIWKKLPTIYPVNNRDMAEFDKWLVDNHYCISSKPRKLYKSYLFECVVNSYKEFSPGTGSLGECSLEIEEDLGKRTYSGIKLKEAAPIPGCEKFMSCSIGTNYLLVFRAEGPQKITLYERD